MEKRKRKRKKRLGIPPHQSRETGSLFATYSLSICVFRRWRKEKGRSSVYRPSVRGTSGRV